MWNRRMAGVTLVELIIAIVIVSAALAGLVAAFTRANSASADPVVSRQMLAIAEGMMEEVMLKPFALNTEAAPTRAQFNDVRDYDPNDDNADGYSRASVEDIDGNPIAGLTGYGVAVRVNRNGLTLPGVPNGSVLKVTVTVTRAGAANVVLTGWRTEP